MTGDYPDTTFLDRAIQARLGELVATLETEGVDLETAYAALRRVVKAL